MNQYRLAELLQRWGKKMPPENVAFLKATYSRGNYNEPQKKSFHSVTWKGVHLNTTRKHSILKWKCKISCNAHWNRTWKSDRSLLCPGNINSRKRKPAKFLQSYTWARVPRWINSLVLTAWKADTKSRRKGVMKEVGTCNFFRPRSRFNKQFQTLYFLSRFFCWDGVTSCQI